LSRIEQLIGERTTRIPYQLIADAIDLIVFISRTNDGRCVKEILRVTGLDAHDNYQLEPASAGEFSLVTEGANA
jgi:type IV secretion system protein TrbB